jgi:hypothetical protein
VMVLLTEDTGHVIGPNIKRLRSGDHRRFAGGRWSRVARLSPHGQGSTSLSWRFEAKLRCQPVVKVATGEALRYWPQRHRGTEKTF